MNRRKFLGVCAGVVAVTPVLAKSDTEWAEGYIKGIKAHKAPLGTMDNPTHNGKRWISSREYYDYLRAGWKEVDQMNTHLHLMTRHG